MPDPSLQHLQEWMKTVIISRGNLAQKLQLAQNQSGWKIEEVIESKRGVSAQRRLDIYAAGYVLRLLECMKCDFPGLQKFMGEPVFDVFAKAYIVSLPPQSWSLYHLGERFPHFLRSTQPKGDFENQDLLDLPAEIAALERTKAEVLYVKGTENTRHHSFGNLSPVDFLQEENFIAASPCLRLLKQKFPLVDFLQQLEKDENVSAPQRKTTYLAVTRANFRLRMTELEHWQFAFLDACKNSVPIQTCAKLAADESETELKTILARLMLWLPVAIENGFVHTAADAAD